MARSNLPDFLREVEAIKAAVVEDWVDRAADLGEQAYAQLIEKTEDVDAVDTGAYRAEHVIEQDGRYLYENPERVGPDEVLPPRKRFGLPPLIEAGDARGALDRVLRPGGFGFANRRFYAPNLEYGTGTMEPRMIYQRARDATEAIAERVAARPSRVEAVRRNGR